MPEILVGRVMLWKSTKKAALGADKNEKKKGRERKTKSGNISEMILNFIMTYLTNFPLYSHKGLD